jgi:hypothetical protein
MEDGRYAFSWFLVSALLNDNEAAGETVFHLGVRVLSRDRGDVANPRGDVISHKADYSASEVTMHFRFGGKPNARRASSVVHSVRKSKIVIESDSLRLPWSEERLG